MARFRKKPLEFTGEQITEAMVNGEAPLPPGVRSGGRDPFSAGRQYLYVYTAGYRMVPVGVGDWIVPEAGGDGHYPIDDKSIGLLADRID